MPCLQIRFAPNSSDYLTNKITIPSAITAKHLHLKAVMVRLNSTSVDETKSFPEGVEIAVPFLKHYYQINSSSSRTNIFVPFDIEKKTTIYYPDIVFVGEYVDSSFNVKLLDPNTGNAWNDGTNNSRVIKYVSLLFEYSVE